jgi:hypothetical protein
VDEYNNNPRGDLKERFLMMEEQFTNISYNMEILMVGLERKFEPFGEFSSSYLDIVLDKKI